MRHPPSRRLGRTCPRHGWEREMWDVFKPPLLQSKTKPLPPWPGQDAGYVLREHPSRPGTAPLALSSNGDEHRPWHGVDARLEISAELAAASVRGAQRSRAVPSGLPS